MARGLIMDMPLEAMKEQANWWSNIQEGVKIMLEICNVAPEKWSECIKAMEVQGLKKDDGKKKAQQCFCCEDSTHPWDRHLSPWGPKTFIYLPGNKDFCTRGRLKEK